MKHLPLFLAILLTVLTTGTLVHSVINVDNSKYIGSTATVTDSKYWERYAVSVMGHETVIQEKCALITWESSDGSIDRYCATEADWFVLRVGDTSIRM